MFGQEHSIWGALCLCCQDLCRELCQNVRALDLFPGCPSATMGIHRGECWIVAGAAPMCLRTLLGRTFRRAGRPLRKRTPLIALCPGYVACGPYSRGHASDLLAKCPPLPTPPSSPSLAPLSLIHCLSHPSSLHLRRGTRPGPRGFSAFEPAEPEALGWSENYLSPCHSLGCNARSAVPEGQGHQNLAGLQTLPR